MENSRIKEWPRIYDKEEKKGLIKVGLFAKVKLIHTKL